MTVLETDCSVITRPAPPRSTSVTLTRMDAADTPSLPPVQRRDLRIATSSARFKIAPRSRAVAKENGEVSAVAAAQSQAADEMLAFAIKWKASVLDRAAGRRSRDLTKTVEPVMQALLSYGPAAIDLRDLPLDRVNGMHLAVVLRLTFTRREQTPGWNQALAIAQTALNRDHISVTAALSGLL